MSWTADLKASQSINIYNIGLVSKLNLVSGLFCCIQSLLLLEKSATECHLEEVGLALKLYVEI